MAKAAVNVEKRSLRLKRAKRASVSVVIMVVWLNLNNCKSKTIQFKLSNFSEISFY